MTTLYAERRGSGPSLVLLPGMAAHHALWGNEFLDAAGERFELLLLDHRGTGATPRGPIPFTVEDLANDAAEAVLAAGVERPLILGHSMGGMVALELALTGDLELGGLVLLATSGGGPQPVLDPAGVALLNEAMAANDPAQAVQASWEANVSAGAARNGPLDEWCAALGTYRLHLPSVSAQRTAVEAFDARGRLAELTRLPVRIAHGTEDQIIPPREAKTLANAIPGAILTLMEGAGHLLTWERPTEVVELAVEATA